MTWKLKAIDISKWNARVDFNAMKAQGILGVIIKASEGATGKDPKCRTWAAAAQKAGLRLGFYHFQRPGRVATQVENFLACAKPGDDALMALDHEVTSIPKAEAVEFLHLLETKLGRKGKFYSYYAMIKQKWRNQIDPYLASHDLWLAQYSRAPSALPMWPTPWLWQNSGSATLPGVVGKIDTNKFAGADAKLLKEWA